MTPPDPLGADLTIARRAPGRAAGEERVVLANAAGEEVARGLWFRGGAGLRPWVDLVVNDPRALADIARVLGPGAALMVAYGAGDATDRALRRKVPPAATPLGLALLRAGCRWFKDWYFAEGGREGSTKLMCTLPLDPGRRRDAEAQLAAEMRAFLARPNADEDDRRRAHEALAVIAADPAPGPGA
jgi:hypothetical protein